MVTSTIDMDLPRGLGIATGDATWNGYNNLLSSKSSSMLTQYESTSPAGYRQPTTVSNTGFTSSNFARPEVRYGLTPLVGTTVLNEGTSFNLSSQDSSANTQADVSYSTTGTSFDVVPSYLSNQSIQPVATSMSGFYNQALTNMSPHITDYTQWGYGSTSPASGNYIYGYGSPSLTAGYTYPAMANNGLVGKDSHFLICLIFLPMFDDFLYLQTHTKWFKLNIYWKI